MLNEEFILSYIEPNLNAKRELSEFEFFELFSDLTRKEHYEIVNIMIEHDIDLVEEKEEETILLDQVEVLKHGESDKDYKKLLHLSNEQLCILAQDGERGAAAAILEKNKRFVYGLALKIYGQFSQSCLTTEDLFQEGNIGLLESIVRFDASKDNKFLTYSWHWIRQRITRAAIDNGYLIRLPVHMYEKVSKINNYRHKNPDANIDDLVQEFNQGNEVISRDEIVYLIVLADQYLNTTSLNTLVGEDESTELLDFIPDEEALSAQDIVIAKQLSSDIENALSTLKPKEVMVVRMRMGFDDGKEHTLEEIGKIFNVTRERIRQIEARAIKKLRHTSRSKKLKPYYEEV